MPRPLPNINYARILTNLGLSISGSNYVATACYVVGCAVVTGATTAYHDVAWAAQGSGSVTVTEPQTTPAGQIQQAVVQAIAAAEGLSHGDVVVLPDGTVVTL